MSDGMCCHYCGRYNCICPEPPEPSGTSHLYVTKAAYDLKSERVIQLERALREYRELAGCCYQFAGAHKGDLEWLNALSAAANGEPFKTDSLLPYTLPEDRRQFGTDEGEPIIDAALEGK